LKLTALLGAIAFSASFAITANPISNEIKAVESGLRNSIHFSNDPLWSIDERMKHYGVPGVSIAVIKDFKIHWAKTYGLADKETQQPVTKNTLFQAASISKPVSAYAALKLVEQKKLSLDNPVNDLLIDWKIPQNTSTQKQPVALKHLLSHSGGLNLQGFRGYAVNAPLPSVIQILEGEEPANSKPLRVVRHPGTRFRYSGGGYTVLQKLVTDITKTNYPEVMIKLLLSPLGMKQSSFQQPLPTEKLKYAAAGYYNDQSPVIGKRHTYPELAAAGLWSTSEDIAKFIIDVLLTIKNDTGRVLSQNMANKMLTPFSRQDMGLGFYLMDKKDDLYFFHQGTNKGFESEFFAHKNKGFGVVIMINSNHKEFISELKNSVAAYYQWDNFISPSFTSLPINQQEQRRITGRYRLQPDVSFNVYAENGHLFKKEPFGPKQEMFKVGENEYITKADDTIISFQKSPKTGSIEYTVKMPNGKFWGRPRLKDDESMPLDLVILGRVTEAEKAYLQFFEKKPMFKVPSEGGLLQAINKLARSEKHDLTLPLLQMSTRLFATGEKSWQALAKYHQQLGNINEVISTYQKAIKLQPENEKFKQELKSLGK